MHNLIRFALYLVFAAVSLYSGYSFQVRLDPTLPIFPLFMAGFALLCAVLAGLELGEVLVKLDHDYL